MTIAADRARFFWLPTDPVTATEPAPATFDGSFILPCFDMAEYAARLQLALAEVGKDPNPANNAGDFIYIADWWLGLRGGRFDPPKSYFASGGPGVLDEGGFD